ncbi:hypothetical protein WICPIJ_005880 [Wickerhamomyces pijperi]|uniref:Uncharacterized protein n=1 Tax=Wickerhamomyces pijperi TaxID=599730 RepID=A0A9P8Q372_WICPI|nr:hypothetical protein WICPIJ_005880 [Wickerhamomyces pijperi]
MLVIELMPVLNKNVKQVIQGLGSDLKVVTLHDNFVEAGQGRVPDALENIVVVLCNDSMVRLRFVSVQIGDSGVDVLQSLQRIKRILLRNQDVLVKALVHNVTDFKTLRDQLTIQSQGAELQSDEDGFPTGFDLDTFDLDQVFKTVQHHFSDLLLSGVLQNMGKWLQEVFLELETSQFLNVHKSHTQLT